MVVCADICEYISTHTLNFLLDDLLFSDGRVRSSCVKNYAYMRFIHVCVHSRASVRVYVRVCMLAYTDMCAHKHSHMWGGRPALDRCEGEEFFCDELCIYAF